MPLRIFGTVRTLGFLVTMTHGMFRKSILPNTNPMSELQKKIITDRAVKFFQSQRFRRVGRKGETNKILI